MVRNKHNLIKVKKKKKALKIKSREPISSVNGKLDF